MKKILSILVIAGIMTACNSGAEEKTTTDSTTTLTVDSSNLNTGTGSVGDTSHVGDSSHMGDSMNKKK